MANDTPMTDKIDYYDIVSHIIPGTILMSWIPVCFPSILAIAVPKYPEAFATFALIALSLFVGQLVLAISSIVVEPLLYRWWGGRPSDQVFTKGIEKFSKEDAARVRAKLSVRVGGQASDASLFLCAMQLSESATDSRVPKFNGLYAYHRCLTTLVLICSLLFLFSFQGGLAASWSLLTNIAAIAAQVILLGLVLKRTHQRANYYVREVLLTAERILDQSSQPSASH
jgi:hypothetical protein